MPPKGRPFKKGQSGNPGGRPKMPDDVREALSLTRVEIAEKLTGYLKKTRLELKAIADNHESTMLELTIASILMKAMHGGDTVRLNFVLDRIVGKVSDKIEHTGADGEDLFKSIADVVREAANLREREAKTK